MFPSANMPSSAPLRVGNHRLPEHSEQACPRKGRQRETRNKNQSPGMNFSDKMQDMERTGRQKQKTKAMEKIRGSAGEGLGMSERHPVCVTVESGGQAVRSPRPSAGPASSVPTCTRCSVHPPGRITGHTKALGRCGDSAFTCPSLIWCTRGIFWNMFSLSYDSRTV